MCARVLAGTAILAVVGHATVAFAQPSPSPAPADAVAALEKELDRGIEALTTASCPVACEALASMRRAAERLCALDPGPRCASARARVRDASRKVEASCAECRTTGRDEIARDPKPQEPASSAPSEPAREPEADRGPHAKGDAPVASKAEAMVVKSRGGCAGCVVSGDEDPGGAGALAAIAASALLAALARRRRFPRA